MEIPKENDLLKLALEVFKKNLPVQVEFEEMEPLHGTGKHVDCVLRMVIHGKEIRYCVEVKANVTKTDKLLAMMRKGGFEHPLLLVAKYINGQMAEQLKRDGIEFIDTGYGISAPEQRASEFVGKFRLGAKCYLRYRTH